MSTRWGILVKWSGRNGFKKLCGSLEFCWFDVGFSNNYFTFFGLLVSTFNFHSPFLYFIEHQLIKIVYFLNTDKRIDINIRRFLRWNEKLIKSMKLTYIAAWSWGQTYTLSSVMMIRIISHIFFNIGEDGKFCFYQRT